MKNQYIGDIGDYGKYGLLRSLASRGIRIGVNWYLCPDDGRTDGNHTEYLLDERMRVYDAALYDVMRDLAFREGKSIRMVEDSRLFDGITFYSEPLNLDSLHWSQRAEGRDEWHRGALKALTGQELIFADPDNGLSANKKASQKASGKFIFPNEIADYYRRGQDVVYYHHRSRKKAVGWMDEKTQLRRFLPGVKLMAISFRRWSCRAYIFVIHEARADFYHRILDGFMASAWGSCRVDGRVPFTYEEIR